MTLYGTKSWPMLEKILQERLVIMDGAMGTMLQHYNLTEEECRGTEFVDCQQDLCGCHDILNITRPDIIESIHTEYLEAGSDVIETNTFNSTTVSLTEYELEDLDTLSYRLNKLGAEIACRAAQKVAEATDTHRFVAGAMGPTTRTASICPSVDFPDFRAITYDDLVHAYTIQAKGLVDGGVDMLLLETIFDTLNAKAAIRACLELFESIGYRIPLVISGTITDASGRTLSAQTVEALYASIRHAQPLAVGLNCALGAAQMRPHLAKLSNSADCHIVCYPNAGLPNAWGDYDQGPEDMALALEVFMKDGLTNLVGVCCGTYPAHIQTLANLARNHPPRKIQPQHPKLLLAGIETFEKAFSGGFINIGTACDVSQSLRFRQIVKNRKFDEAIHAIKEQIAHGAQMALIDLDGGSLPNPAKLMTLLCNTLASDPDCCKRPFCIQSKDEEVLLAGLKCIQGKPIASAIDCSKGVDEFKRLAKQIFYCGAAVVVNAKDDQLDALSSKQKVDICTRMFKILTEEIGFAGEDIIFNPLVPSTMSQSKGFVAFFETVRLLKEALPCCQVIATVDAIATDFKAPSDLRNALYSVFLYHAISYGLDMAFVHAGALPPYTTLSPKVVAICEDAILHRNDNATNALQQYAEAVEAKADADRTTNLYNHHSKEEWRSLPPQKRLVHALTKGITSHVAEDVEECREMRNLYPTALKVIEGPLMEGMQIVGELFESGKLFLPQVIKSARVMKKAVAHLVPFIEREKIEAILQGRAIEKRPGKILLGTVKGDVHDIGKNIVGVVLSCNNFEVIDAGVMCSAEKLLEIATEEKVDLIGLSGLITPSLNEMVQVAQEMRRVGFTIPLMIGGAATSAMHTAVKIEPHYHHGVAHVRDASQAVIVASQLLGKEKEDFLQEIEEIYDDLKEDFLQSSREWNYLFLREARERRLMIEFHKVPPASEPKSFGVTVVDGYELNKCVDRIDWNPFFALWQLRGKYPNRGYPRLFNDENVGKQAQKLFDDAQVMLAEIVEKNLVRCRGVMGLYPANSVGDDIEIYKDESRTEKLTTLHGIRQQLTKEGDEPYLCISDFVASKESRVRDYIGMFAVAAFGCEELCEKYERDSDDYSTIMAKALCDRIAESFGEALHEEIRTDHWGYAPDENFSTSDLLRQNYVGIRPAPGYPSQPDHHEKEIIWDLLKVEENTGISLTENGAMQPAASVCALCFAHPHAKYFAVGKITKEQVVDYARRKGIPVREAERHLASILGYDPAVVV